MSGIKLTVKAIQEGLDLNPVCSLDTYKVVMAFFCFLKKELRFLNAAMRHQE
jgi:hypothetical protein